VQLLKGCSLLRPGPPARHQNGEELVRAVEGLGKAVALVQVGLHLERVNLWVGLLGSGHQLPQDDPEGPLKVFKC